MNKETSSIIVDIIRQQMDLPNNQVWVRDQSRTIPTTKDLFVVVGMTDSSVFSSTNYMKQEVIDDNLEQVECQELCARENIQIDVFSKSNEILLKRWQVIAALNSIYAKQQQEKYNFKICKLPTAFANTSIAEGGSQLNRYSLSFSCLMWYRNKRILSPTQDEYFDTFETRVDDEKTIGTDAGIFEFALDGDMNWIDEDLWIDSEGWQA